MIQELSIFSITLFLILNYSLKSCYGLKANNSNIFSFFRINEINIMIIISLFLIINDLFKAFAEKKVKYNHGVQ